jgi:hypothetical protein
MLTSRAGAVSTGGSVSPALQLQAGLERPLWVAPGE